MEPVPPDPARLRRAWQGRISGCQLGKPVELLSMMQGRAALRDYLEKAGATVGGLLGLLGSEIPARWCEPWRERVAVDLAGVGELALDSLAGRTLAVAQAIAQSAGAGA